MQDHFVLAGRKLYSRLFVGSARFPNAQIRKDAWESSGTEIITVSMRRAEAGAENMLQYIDRQRYHILPNTAGCYTAKDAILTAQLARESLETNWIKLEIIGDRETLYPDVVELLKAAQELVNQGFSVLPYCNDDPITCCKLQDLGCAAIMPLGAPIGSGMGLCNPYQLQLLRELIKIPLIVDAGLGTASDAALALELGADAVLVNTAIAQAEKPALMAQAFKHACTAGRAAFLAGRIPKKNFAQASSPWEGTIACYTLS